MSDDEFDRWFDSFPFTIDASDTAYRQARLVADAAREYGQRENLAIAQGVVSEERESMVRRSEKLQGQLVWVMSTWLENHAVGGGTIPDHDCWFSTKPDAGCCPFHEHWYAAAESCGLLEEWAEAALEEAGDE
jgi:hypothetical protein